MSGEVVKLASGKSLPVKTLLIGIPTCGDMKIECVLSLIFMIHLLDVNHRQKIGDVEFSVRWAIEEVRSSNLPQSRQKLVDAALTNNVDWLLFLDDDMVFEAEFIFDWIKQNRPVMAMNCPTRQIPSYPTARRQSATEPFKGELVYSDSGIPRERYEKVWRVGTGIMMIRQDVLRALPRPAFTPRWEPGNDHYVGEDWAFIENVEKAGYPVYVDHEASELVKHVGDMAFHHGMVKATRMKIAEQRKEKSGIIIPGIVVPDNAQ